MLLLFAVVIARTLAFVPKAGQKREPSPIAVSADSAAEHLAMAVRCRTVSMKDKSRESDEEFKRFEELIRSLYPTVHSKATLEHPTDRALLYRIRGTGEESPAVLMAHYDVVSVDEDGWDKPPFAGVIEDGYLFGRGTLDTKCSLIGILEALEELLKSGFVPQNDIYLAFGGDEEINGSGARSIVSLFAERGITPSLVLDEGGAVVSDVFPGVSERCALIGIAEKGMLNVEYTVKGGGGHSSSPKPHTPVGILSRACVRMEQKPFAFRISAPAKEMLDTLARHSTFVYRMIFANLWLFSPILNLITRKSGGELNALLRTTTAFTQMEGSLSVNVIPPKASMCSNHRIAPGEKKEETLERIRRCVADSRVEIREIDGMDPSVVSDTKSSAYALISETVSEVWQDAIVSPYLMIACSDSRHWGVVSDKVFRFSPMALTKEERASIHGNNERISLESIGQIVEFYTRLITRL